MYYSILFYIFSFFVILSSIGVITSKNPVYCVLYLILAFINSAILFLFLNAEFLAMLLIVVYVGAVAVLFLFVVTTLAYFYPVIKHAKNKLDCEVIAKNYIIKNKNTVGINNREIRMLSTNFCYGGEEIYEIEN